ncbi:MAG: UDP-N-acetylmuramate-L-alanine ligase [Candidatus Magasanikbacteria bacterium GW2011_GWC2_40_17]|uniref:UDP-N-acetylmuramate--L-alanine ligase n=1 Tax=Candidatus Magasanikbacteria bacterium GW2011_GWA2_42_32 TaxID=1619039 RepID=A0A0G1A8V0_9BACT|nr:MAG: UDP-N-acetylmuramate-L-alanine ligase [Candidatus Magasanikbacteria bacterium GW2011_GWC2_40_17]KKS57450.1 MAG: UDP-N-acetylmuramate-L-alanine ligase [Candidatus Magasanikbacteria bacterium GW2011_GWA2_42_32]OGH85557.1 MAG: UDP-N-acetylmuramate--L-alanine ligase [Candidatus Magasanikbacteria bacterium RIFOXYB2_FULL_38_10]
MSFFSIKKIHFVGIGGHGVSALARLACVLKMEVSGSDLERTAIVDEVEKAGAKIWIGHDKDHLEIGVEMVVYTSAARENENIELLQAQKLNIPTFSYFEALGLISQERETIAVSGTNGKTTTTLMLGKILEEGGLDPLIIAGGNIEGEHGGGFRFGKGPFVVEACEAYGNFLHLHPTHLIITNIEEDHLDYYKDLEAIIKAFKKVVGNLKPEGYLLINGDDEGVKRLESKLGDKLKIKKFGLNKGLDFIAEDVNSTSEFQTFVIQSNLYRISIPGLFNVYNALAAVSTALSLGVKSKAIQLALENFKNSWRRFQILGNYKKATIISDYGHHPAGVVGTIEAARQKYPGQRIVTVFHPHHKWRTRMLFNDFIKAFLQSDVVILNEIWSAPGREPREDNISSQDLVMELKKRGQTESYFGANLDKTKEILDTLLRQGDVVLMMGAGYIYKLAEKITKDSRII